MGLILDRLSEIQYASGEFAGAAETASHWIALDALNEVAYRRKMRAHFAAGERGRRWKPMKPVAPYYRRNWASSQSRIRRRWQSAFAHRSPSLTPVAPRLLDTSVAFLGNLFAGRASEYQVLMNSYERAAAGQPQLVVLRGETGIGKTRLARKFLAWASTQGAELLQGSAFESGRHLPFQPLVDALRLRLEGKNSLKNLLEPAELSSLSQMLPELNDIRICPLLRRCAFIKRK